ncbi:AzlC family ABC transporter permease [Desulfofalx alkaliphila]|uniref:AzlC family ABC transporter permease n=1 Tax=Desulfofalx alkaliphila TaxID=105483 RepID=UPI000ADC6B32|nr:AzlC family ABC transporter permease [Desulfofalx alkaliphila]
METKIASNETAEPMTINDGLKLGLPIAIGYIPSAIAFGLLAKSAGLPDHISIMMSFFVFAGASQFMAVNLLTLGVVYWEIVLATFILNSRHFLMSAALSQRVRQGTSKKWLSLVSFGVTDETFAVASLSTKKPLSPKFLLGLNFIAFFAWNVGTWVGVFLAAGLPEALKTSMGMALYAMFIGLLVPSLRKSLPVLTVALMAMVIHSVLYWVPMFSGISSGWSIIIATIIAATAGTVLFPRGVNN